MNVHLVKDEFQRFTARGSSEIYESYFFEPRWRGIEDVSESLKRRPAQRLRVDNLAGLRAGTISARSPSLAVPGLMRRSATRLARRSSFSSCFCLRICSLRRLLSN